ncbi:hypothetical protein [Solicola sp. PLA-1-18]|uniref:hypothetical protein n=1 Tax=Solicola sp. PLA-1-18 TaxID=3380532 RepID=UPI003B809F03
MPRRVSLPGADELFRPTAVPDPPAPAPVAEPAASEEPRVGSGRVKHDEKMTVYVTADELLEIEQTRLLLRRALGQGVDRGRLVRAAIAMALADYEEQGLDGELARRLQKP